MDTPCPFLIFAQLTPRIFDFPIFSCFFRTHSTITHCQYPVVQRCAAGTGKDPGLVKLKPGLVGFNGNGHRLFVKRRHQRFLGLPDIGVFFHGGAGDLFAFLVAGAAGAGVRVGGFRAQTFVGVNEIKRIVHQTTVAALVHFGVAIDQILFGKRRQRASFQEVSAFQRPGGGKGPATAALALVLDGRDSVLFGPIHGCWGGIFDGLGRQSVVDVFGPFKVFVRVFDTGVDFGKSIPRHVREFVVANGGGVSFGVVLLDKRIVGFEGLELGIHFGVGVIFAEQLHPGFESGTGIDLGRINVDGARQSGGGAGCQGC